MSPTIVHLADYGGPYPGSFIPMLLAAARAVRGAGWEFDCAFHPVARGRPWLDQLAREGIEPEFAPVSGERELASWIEDYVGGLKPPVILHSHFSGFDIAAAAAARRIANAAAIWHVHSFLRSDLRRVARAAFKLRVLSRGATIICVSDATAAAVRRRGAPGARIRVVRNGIDTERFALVDPDLRAAARERLDLPPPARVLLHFAYNWTVKGGPLFSQMVARLRGSGVDVIALSVGGGEEAQAAVAELGLDGVLRPVDQADDPLPFYAAADAFVATSAGEGAPFATLEALSCGVPVVATDTPGHRLAPQPPRALRLGPLDPEGLAGLTADVLDRPRGEREAEAAEAHRWVRENRSLAVWASEILGIYRELLPAGSD